MADPIDSGLIDIRTWFDRDGLAARPWLILGKGPSFSHTKTLDLSPYHTLALNHVVREMPVTAAHVIDADILDDCADAIRRQARYLVMPFRPHLGGFETDETLLTLRDRFPILGEMAAAGRLVYYNFAPSSRPPVPGAPVVYCWSFSAVAAIGLLSHAGARVIRSLGVDGGLAYSGAFGDLSGTTRLANGRPSFDLQFREIAHLIRTHDLDYAPLHKPAPIRVFIGSERAQALPARVLEFSIKKHATMSVAVTPMHAAEGAAGDVDRDWAGKTPFSLQRFEVPRLAGQAGRAIYLDADMQVFRDLTELWDLPFAGAQVIALDAPPYRRDRYSVLVLDCDNLDWDLDRIRAAVRSGATDYADLLYRLLPDAGRVRHAIPPHWNSLERFQRGRTGLIHYSNMRYQPWTSLAHPHVALWVSDLIEAVESGAIPLDAVRDAVDRGHIRPSLLHQVTRRMADPWALPAAVRERDRGFVPAAGIALEPAAPAVSRLPIARAVWARLFWRFAQSPWYPRLLTARQIVDQRTPLHVARARLRLARAAAGPAKRR